MQLVWQTRKVTDSVCLVPNLALLLPALCSLEMQPLSWKDAYNIFSGQIKFKALYISEGNSVMYLHA